MKIDIVRTYNKSDTEFIRDALQEELFVDDDLILSGDWYHDSISSKMDGFLEALDFLDIPYTLNEIDVNSEFDEDED
jgi:hypothetical protein